MRGVLVHAYVASQLLRTALDGHAPMAVLSHWSEALWILLWVLAGAALAVKVRSPWVLASVVSCGILVLGLVDLLAFIQGHWLPFIPAALAWAVAATMTSAYLSKRLSVEWVTLKQLFARLMSKDIAEFVWRMRYQILKGRRPEPQPLVGTALFADLAGFVGVGEKLAPPELLRWMNEYMRAEAPEVLGHGGVIRQYAGDQMVAFFGVPVPRKTEAEIDADARSAVACALAIEAAVRKLNPRLRAEGRPALGMRVGILTGPMVVGVLGSDERWDLVIEGDTVNTASRIESYDKKRYAPDPDRNPVRILIGEATYRRLGEEFDTECIGSVPLSGKEGQMTLYRVLGRTSPPSLRAA
jgi:adenylate cyclase